MSNMMSTPYILSKKSFKQFRCVNAGTQNRTTDNMTTQYVDTKVIPLEESLKHGAPSFSKEDLWLGPEKEQGRLMRAK